MDQTLRTVIYQAEEAGIATPATVIEAAAFQTTAAELTEKIAGTLPLDLHAATAATLAKTFEQVVQYDVQAGARTARARELTDLAESRIEQAWRAAIPAMQPAFAKAFDATATKFTAESDRLAHVPTTLIVEQYSNENYAEAHRLAARLDDLRRVRDYYANDVGPLADVGNDRYERASRTLILQSAALSINPPAGMSGRGLLHWLTAARHDGITIAWQTAAQQPAQPGITAHVQAIARQKAGLAATLADRAAAHTGRA